MKTTSTTVAAAAFLPFLLLTAAAAAASTPKMAAELNLRAPLRTPFKQVHVLNELTNNKPIHVHCHSRDGGDMGTRDVAVGTEYMWRFRPSPVGTTRWSCDVTTNDGRRATFDSYWEDVAMTRREYRGNTYWVAEEDGIYLRPIQGNRDEIHATWVSVPVMSAPAVPATPVVASPPPPAAPAAVEN